MDLPADFMLRNCDQLRGSKAGPPRQDFCRRVLRTRGYELRGAAAKAVGAEETLALSFRCTAAGTKRTGKGDFTTQNGDVNQPTMGVSG